MSKNIILFANKGDLKTQTELVRNSNCGPTCDRCELKSEMNVFGKLLPLRADHGVAHAHIRTAVVMNGSVWLKTENYDICVSHLQTGDSVPNTQSNSIHPRYQRIAAYVCYVKLYSQ